MVEGGFKYEDDLLKHHVRLNGWLPRCRERRSAINEGVNPKHRRRLRYFTFCAVQAVDVLMLDVAKLLRSKERHDFGTVVFFDRSRELVDQTQKTIPGAIGYPGNFTDVVLANDPDEDAHIPGRAALDPKTLASDERATRTTQLLLAQRRDFIADFPFDVINLDLEEFAFKPSDPPPGDLIRAFRKLFAWQRNPLVIGERNYGPPNGFTLMFTTQIGPPDISDDYLAMLGGALNQNLELNPALQGSLQSRSGHSDIHQLKTSQFDLFFQLGVQKLVMQTLYEQDWYVDAQSGISLFEFQRQWQEGTYTILHLAMDVKRKHPPLDNRAPGVEPPEAHAAYVAVAEKMFTTAATLVNEALIDKDALSKSLEQIKARRRKFLPDGQQIP